jgi:pyruvate dehydrogenase E1 component alpha subunit
MQKGAKMTDMHDKKIMLELYEGMVLIRKFEERTVKYFKQGKIPGFIHLYIGQEAIATGVSAALNKDDYITSTHRGHGHLIAKGADIKLMMAELFAKRTGYSKAKGGSMHIGDLSIGIMGSNGIVGAGFPLAAGLGCASKMTGRGQVCVCFCGDGATNRGTFHESVNISSVYKFPVIFVCENNRYGLSACIKDTMNICDISVRADSYGIPGASADGNNVLQVYDTAKTAVERARKGEGPSLLEFKTWRQRGHWEGDPDNYRDPEERREWIARDPIILFEKEMISGGAVIKKELEDIQAKVEARLDEAAEFANSSPPPELQELYEDIYA